MKTDSWQETLSAMKVLKLSLPLRLLVPALFVSALPRSAIGFSFERGKGGLTLGLLLVGASMAVGGLLVPVLGLTGAILPFWLLGSAGSALLLGALRPLTFVKPLCTACRLLPVVKEHEAIHLSGMESDDEVWRSMKRRYTSESLSLEGDPRICWFCPIQKRLKEY